MPGAGSLTAANNIYSKAAPDGTALAMFAASAAMEPLLGNKAALFDATKFSWIGSMSQDVAYCGVWQTPGAATSFDEMMTKETIFGGGANGGDHVSAPDGDEEHPRRQHPRHRRTIRGRARSIWRCTAAR